MIIYRLATIGDVSELREVAKKTWIDTFGEKYSKSTVDRVVNNTRSIEYIKNSVERFVTILAIDSSNKSTNFLIHSTMTDR